MATVTKRSWVYKGERKTAHIVRYVDRGGVRRQETFDLRNDAKRRRTEIENELNGGVHVAARETATFGEAADLWLRDLDRRRHLKDRMTLKTQSNYEWACRDHVLPHFAALRLTKLIGDDVQKWIDAQCQRFARRTVARFLVVIDSVLNFAIKQKLLARNVVQDEKVKLPAGRKTRVISPSLDDIKRILDEVNTRQKFDHHLAFLHRKLIVYLGVFAGLRAGEIVGLHWESIDFGRGIIHVRHSYSKLDGLKGTKTDAGMRAVPLVEPVANLLNELRKAEGNPAKGYVIASRRGVHVGNPMCSYNAWRLWRKVAIRAGVTDAAGKPYSLHSLRHANVSLLIADGLNPIHIKTHIGHANVATTLGTYAHLFPEDTRIAASLRNVTEKLQQNGRISH